MQWFSWRSYCVGTMNLLAIWNWTQFPAALPSFHVWEWGWKFQTSNQGLVFLVVHPYPEIIFLLSLPSLALGIILLAYRTHSYHLGNAKCSRNSVPGTREGQRSNMYFFLSPQVFFLVGEEQTRILERWPLRRLFVETDQECHVVGWPSVWRWALRYMKARPGFFFKNLFFGSPFYMHELPQNPTVV